MILVCPKSEIIRGETFKIDPKNCVYLTELNIAVIVSSVVIATPTLTSDCSLGTRKHNHVTTARITLGM